MRRLTLGLALLLAFLLVPGSANASSLKLVGGSHTFHGVSAARCDSDGVAVTATAPNGAGKSSSVVVSNIAAGCLDKSLPLQVWIWDPAAKVVRFTYAPALNVAGLTSVTVAGNQFSPGTALEARVMIGSWPIPATWSYTPPAPLPLVSCVDLSGKNWPCEAAPWFFRWGGHFIAFFEVTSKNPNASTEWQLTINFADPSFPFIPVAVDGNNLSELASGWDCASMPMLVINGQKSSNTVMVGGGKSVNTYLMGMDSGTGSLFTCG